MRSDHVSLVAEAAYAAGWERGPGAAEHVLDVVRAASHHVAAGLLQWDAGARRHRVLATTGYLPSFLTQIQAGLTDGPVFRRLVRARVPLRYDDAPYDFRQMDVYQRILAPVGYGDGLSAALYLDGDRYVGMLHMSADSSDAFGDDVRDFVAALVPVLGHLCDLARLSPGSLGDDYCAQVVTVSEIRPVSGRLLSPVLTEGSGIHRVVAHFLESSNPAIQGLWPDRTRSWRQVVLLRIRDTLSGSARSALVGDRPYELPYGLSGREVDVLTHVSRGTSNLQIAADLCVAPRTVATHVEHILAKLGCESRTGAASRAAREGLIRLDLLEPVF